MANEAIKFRHMLVGFEDGSERRYVMKLPSASTIGKLENDEYAGLDAAINQAAMNLFHKLKRLGKNYGDPFIDKRVCRDPGPKAVQIIEIWDGAAKLTAVQAKKLAVKSA